MTRYVVDVVVQLKRSLLDPQGQAVEGALPTLGWDNVSDVRIGKFIQLVVDVGTEDEAGSQGNAMAEKVLANPVIEDYRVTNVRPYDERGVTWQQR